MKTIVAATLALFVLCPVVGIPAAQAPEGPPPSAVISKSVEAVGYQVGRGTKVNLKATSLMAAAAGEAKVEPRQGSSEIEVEVKKLIQPTILGAEFLTYVLWAVSPEGRTSNLGEIQIETNGEGKLTARTPLQVFSLIVTAEPYFAVRQPSEMVVLVNEIRKDTKGKLFIVNDYKLMKRGQYDKMGNPLALTPDLKNVPLEMYEARNAIDIAKSRSADKYAQEIFTKAEGSMQIAENTLARKANKKEIISAARQAVQFSEDARALSVQRQEEERIANERAAAAAKAKAEAEAKAAVEAAEAKRKADQEAKRQSELAAAREAQLKAESESAALKAKMEADAAAAKAKAEADELKAKEEAAQADAEQARRSAQALRAQLLEQLNRILETRDTSRGLVVTMADVLFDTGKYDLRPTAREHLAKVSGVILGHPSLKLDIEGHTDSTGGDELNQRLSEQRAEGVRQYLSAQGLPPDNLTARGLGKTMPIASNETSDGRQKNRRVELIISGKAIGVEISPR